VEQAVNIKAFWRAEEQKRITMELRLKERRKRERADENQRRHFIEFRKQNKKQ
jgi:hypothetical protein